MVFEFDVEAANKWAVGKTAQEIVNYAVERSQGGAMVSTNFRPQEGVMLHLCTNAQKDMPVLWVDSGFNKKETYIFAEKCIDKFNLNVKPYLPKVSAAHRNATKGGVPTLNQEEAHGIFTEEVKLEPFKRGLAEMNPTVWFTGLRKEQTAFRSQMEVFTRESDNMVKVCPVLDWKESDMINYVKEHDLPDETEYFDPTKVDAKRECGLHTMGPLAKKQKTSK